MSKKPMTADTDVLDSHTLELLAESQKVVHAAPADLRKRVLQRIDDDIQDSKQSFMTVRADDGAWIEVGPKIKMKVLFSDPESGTESYLLKAEPGAEAQPHLHKFDEHCLVLEGEVSFGGGVHLRKGDYHFAPGGTEHGIARTDIGVLVYIQSGPSLGMPA